MSGWWGQVGEGGHSSELEWISNQEEPIHVFWVEIMTTSAGPDGSVAWIVAPDLLIVHAFVAFPSLSCFHWWQLFFEMLNCNCANTYHTLKHLFSWPCLGDKRYVNSRNINNQKVDFLLYYFYNKYKYNIQNFAWNNQVSNINGKPSIWSQFLEDAPSTSHCRSASPVPVSNPSHYSIRLHFGK